MCERVNLCPRGDLSFGICLVGKHFRSVRSHDSGGCFAALPSFIIGPAIFHPPYTARSDRFAFLITVWSSSLHPGDKPLFTLHGRSPSTCRNISSTQNGAFPR